MPVDLDGPLLRLMDTVLVLPGPLLEVVDPVDFGKSVLEVTDAPMLEDV